MRDQWYRSDNEMKRLTQAGVSADVIDAAMTSFILQTIVQHGEAAERLCNKVVCLPSVWSLTARLFSIVFRTLWLSSRGIISPGCFRNQNGFLWFEMEEPWFTRLLRGIGTEFFSIRQQFLVCRHITITGYKHDNPQACLRRWNTEVKTMMEVCQEVGRDRLLSECMESQLMHCIVFSPSH